MFSTSAFRLWSLAFLAPGEEKPPPLVRRPVFVSGAASNPGNVVRSRQSTKRAQGVAGAGYMREGGRELWKWPAASITFSGKRWKSSAQATGFCGAATTSGFGAIECSATPGRAGRNKVRRQKAEERSFREDGKPNCCFDFCLLASSFSLLGAVMPSSRRRSARRHERTPAPKFSFSPSRLPGFQIPASTSSFLLLPSYFSSCLPGFRIPIFPKKLETHIFC